MLSYIKRLLSTAFLVHVPAFPGKRRIASSLNGLFKGAAVRTAYGVDMIVDAADSTNYFSITGAYGSLISDVIREFPANSAFLDVGANAGLFSLVAAGHYCDGVVVSFEPQLPVASALLNNVAVNGFDNVLVLNCAVGQDTGWLGFRRSVSHSGSVHMTSMGADADAGDAQQRALVMSAADLEYTVKAIVAQRKVIVKIDVEGAECVVAEQLLCLAESLDFAVFIVEVSEENLLRFGNSKHELYSLFERAGFDPTVAKADKDRKFYDEVFRKT